MRLISLLLLFIVIFSFSVIADLAIDETSLNLIGEENDALSQNFTIRNTDTVNTLANIQFNYEANDFSDRDNTISLTFEPVSIASLAPQTSQSVKLTANIPNNMDIGVYSGSINATSGALTDSFTLKVVVKPEICSDGIQGNDLFLDINDPGDGDNFRPNQELSLDIDVDNDGNNDLDVVVEALLYNMNKGKKIASIESDPMEVQENDKEAFDNLDLKIPTDSKYLKEGEDYILFIKAYEDGDEDQNCNEDFVELNLELEEDEVIIESMKFLPPTVSCGDSVTATLVTRNIGSDNQDDVRIELNQAQLKINEVSSFFDLDDFNDKDDNDYTTTFTFTIPEDADEKEYKFDATVNFGGSDTYTFDTLDTSSRLMVSECGKQQEEITSVSSQAQLNVLSVVKSAAIGSTLSIPYTVTNTGSASQTYTVEFVPSGTWSTKQSQTVTVGAGQASQNTITALINSGISEGLYSGTIRLLSGDTLLDSKTISLELLNPNAITTRAVYRKTFLDDLRINNLSTAFWIIGNLILAIIIAVLAYLLLKK